MKNNDNILVIGGDRRYEYLYLELKKQNYKVFDFDITNISKNSDMDKYLDSEGKLSSFNIIILPIPYSKNKLTINSISNMLSIDYLLSLLIPGTIIYGGCFDDNFKEKCHSKKLMVWDFLNSPAFSLNNSIATAEGSILEAIIHSPLNLHKSNALVLGYGKCGTIISTKLISLNCNVCVCARKSLQRAKAYNNGCDTLSFDSLKEKIDQFDFIFNTVPAPILTKDILPYVNSNVTIIDIASNPGGTDFDFCKESNINAHLCLGLPGKYSPLASAKIILNCIKT